MRIKRPTHATVVAYLALFVALGGSAYAVQKIGSKDIADNSIKSEDLKNRRAVAGKDVRPDTLGGGKIRETTLNAADLAAVAAGGGGGCDPTSSAFVVCSETSISVAQPSRVIVIGSAGLYGSATAKSTCEVRVDGVVAGEATPGEVESTTDANATNGFSASGISFNDLAAGNHQATLECNQVTGDAKFSNPSIVAIAVGI